MSKRGKKATVRKTKPSRQKARQQSPQTSTAKKLLKYLTSTTAIVSFLVAIFGFLFLVYPRISVYPGQPINFFQPFKTPFIVRNDGYLPVSDVTYSMGIEKITWAGGGIMEDFSIMDGYKNDSNTIPLLRSNTSSPIFLKWVNIPNGLLESAEVYITLTYKPFLIPFTFHEERRFKTEQNGHGEYFWLEYFAKP